MDDDSEIQSHTSASPNGSPSDNGRITVTVASAPMSVSPTEENKLALALPVQQQKPNGGGREDCWSEGGTAVLIEAWGERYLELSRGNLKQKHWKEVADIVSSREDYSKTPKTDIQCKNRIDTVKKKYKLEKAKIASGGGPSKWVFFEKLDRLIGTSAKVAVNSSGGGGGLSAKVPMGIPVGVRTGMNQFRASQETRRQEEKQTTKTITNKKTQSRKRGPVDSDEDEEDEEEEDLSADSMDSLPPPPPPPPKKKTMRIDKEVGSEKRVRGWGSSVRELTRAILRFGEAYEQAESAKLQQVVEMEKQRMKFAKELELQRMQFFMKTQLEISQLRHGKRVTVMGHSSNHRHGNVNSTTNNYNSESSS